MKKAISTLFMISFLLSLSYLSTSNPPVKADSNVWIVDDDGPADFSKIQEAINSPLVSDGDTIYVCNGTYRENIVLNKTVSLVGENINVAVIDGNNAGSVIYINVSYASVRGFTIRNSGVDPYDSGIFIYNSVGNNISYNKILNTNDAISVYYSSDAIVSNNIICFSYFQGVVLYSSVKNSICSNNLSVNLYGAYLRYSDDNVISSNTVSSSFYYGIYLYSSSRNLVSGNTISANNIGMHINSYSVNNTVYHNNFNNTKNAESEAVSSWDYDSEGNYWNDYTGQDLNEDGIGDNPYILGGVNQDNYPLMGIFSDFNIALEEETYSVTIISNSTISDLEFRIGAQTRKGIVSFDATGVNSTIGFCRIKIPTMLMEYPYIVLVDSEEVVPIELAVSSEINVCLYFTYPHNCSITIFSSETLRLYYELLNKYFELLQAFSNLNETYHELLDKFSMLQSDLYALNETYYSLLTNFSQLQIDIYALNETYFDLLFSFSQLQSDLYALNETYYSLLTNFSQLQIDIYALNKTYYGLLANFSLLSDNYSQLQDSFEELEASYQVIYGMNESYHILLDNYTQLQKSFDQMNNSYQEHLIDYSEQVQNFRNLTYVFAALTAIFIITTIYLSKRAHAKAIIKSGR